MNLVDAALDSAAADLITRFYTAFQQRNAAGMAACYHQQIHFSDPVFPDLHGADAAAMWDMLCTRGKDLRVEFTNVQASEQHGSADWTATYTFTSTQRLVTNRISASFVFRDGLIVRHTDHFSLYAWSRQALGPLGLLLGWTPMLQSRVRAQAAVSLARWIAKR